MINSSDKDLLKEPTKEPETLLKQEKQEINLKKIASLFAISLF
jgi:hypothetical protein